MFRFTIRDVLWLMVVVGLAVGCVLAFRKTPHCHTRAGIVTLDSAVVCSEYTQQDSNLQPSVP